MNVTTEKVKVVKATEQVKPDVKIEEKAPIVEDAEKTLMQRIDSTMTMIGEKITKLAGVYDGKYQEEEEAVPGVPGTAEEKKAEGDYDGKYAEGEEEPCEDCGEEEEDCVCEKCGSTYKAKKAKKAKCTEEEKKAESEEEEEEEETMPKKAELAPEPAKADLSAEAWKKAFGMDTMKPSKAMTNWTDACKIFDNDAFVEKK